MNHKEKVETLATTTVSSEGYNCRQTRQVVSSHFKKPIAGVPGWLSRLSIRLLIVAQVMGSSPTSGSALTAWTAWASLSLPLSLCPTLSLPLPSSCSLSQNRIPLPSVSLIFLLWFSSSHLWIKSKLRSSLHFLNYCSFLQ